MKRRSNFTVMTQLIKLIKPLTGYMLLAILMGFLGHLCASFLTIFGGYAVLNLLGFSAPTLTVIFICVCVFALFRGILRYAEQACNHFIAFKLLAFIRAQILMRLALAACSLIAGNVLLVFFTMTIAAPLFLLSLLAAVSGGHLYLVAEGPGFNPPAPQENKNC